MNTYKIIILLIITLYVNFKVNAQESKMYSTGIIEKKSVKSFLELKVIDTDPILKLAKESTPFDRTFFLKIKRNSKGSTTNIGKTKTEVVEFLYPERQDTVKILHKKVEEIKEITSSNKQEKKPSVIEKVSLIDINGSISVDICKKHIYQESDASEFIFIEFYNLKPDRNYKVEIIWSDKIDLDIYYFTTVSPTLDRRLKQRVFSQIGVAAPVFKNGEDIFIRPSLMLGVYYNIRQIDQDIPFKSYKLYALQRFSYLFGLTINSLAEESTRKDLIGNSNILIGIGYQPTDAIRISYGQMIFYEINPNRLISNRISTAGTSYLALTLDIKLKDIIGGVITTLGFK